MKLILIDIDNTLLDFDAYIRQTMEEGFAHFGLRPYEPWMYDVFHRENNKLWRQIEEGTLTFPELEKIRWSNIFAALDMDFDGPTFERYFRAALHESAIPVPGARELLDALCGRYTLAAASNGPYEQQLHRLALAGMKDCFAYFFISQRIGGCRHHRRLPDLRYGRWPGVRAQDRLLPPSRRGPCRRQRGRDRGGSPGYPRSAVKKRCMPRHASLFLRFRRQQRRPVPQVIAVPGDVRQQPPDGDGRPDASLTHRPRQRVGQRYTGAQRDDRQHHAHAGALHRAVEPVQQEQAADPGVERPLDAEVEDTGGDDLCFARLHEKPHQRPGEQHHKRRHGAGERGAHRRGPAP